ncbi:MAG: divalent metal cation transporter [Saprospiraceae bacterium]|nr:divalent metal cation transporter [Saprospiraceae bacterium]MDZ4703594.1 divalent metal cation transporter [Saprospiraceae bacterium]
MSKRITFSKGLSGALLWSVITAAFIGPGTVTTASKAGAGYQLQLLWALAFSMVATILLQEAAARIAIGSGKSLGQILAEKYSSGPGRRICVILFVAVATGCAAYQAGNILGAVSGLEVLSSIPRQWLTLIVGAACVALLWSGKFRVIARLLSLVVLLMGIAFIAVAVQTDFTVGDYAKAMLPTLPKGSLLLVIGLIGTTIVPYNLFLASGIGRGQQLGEMRWGIAIAVMVGGVISMAILVAGTFSTADFTFPSLSATLGAQLGNWASALFAFGLFAAGASSAITAPLAAALAGQSLLGEGNPGWQGNGRWFRATWSIVLATGLLFGMLEVRPIPIIIAAQVINGLLLPVVAAFLLLAVNDHVLLPTAYRNGPWYNAALLGITGIVFCLGMNQIWSALKSLVPSINTDTTGVWIFNIVVTGLALVALGWKLSWRR